MKKKGCVLHVWDLTARRTDKLGVGHHAAKRVEGGGVRAKPIANGVAQLLANGQLGLCDNLRVEKTYNANSRCH